MAIRRYNRRFDRPYHERRYARPDALPVRPLPARPQHYRRLSRRDAWGQPGPFTGIGPRDYHLTDEQIQDAMRDNPSGQGDELTPLILIRPLKD